MSNSYQVSNKSAFAALTKAQRRAAKLAIAAENRLTKGLPSYRPYNQLSVPRSAPAVGRPLGLDPAYDNGSTVWSDAIDVLRGFGANAHIFGLGPKIVSGLNIGQYRDSIGTATGLVDQTVGLAFDAGGVTGIELAGATRNTYNATWSSTTYPITVTSTAALNYGILYNPLLTIGSMYQVVVTWSGNSLNRNLSFDDGQGPANTQMQSTAVNGTINAVFIAASTTFFMYAAGIGGAGETFTINNISVREVTGSHAKQSTAANRPILRRGAVNLLTYSQDFSNAAWVKSNVTLTPGQIDSAGGTSATRKVVGAGSEHQAIAVTASTTYTAVFRCKNNGGTEASYAIYDNTGAAFIIGVTSYLSQISAGWAHVVIPFTTPVSCVSIRIYDASSAANTDLISEGCALFQGTYTASQIQALGGIPLTTTAPASTSGGNYYWEFDGVNDSLAISTPLFQMTDDWCVIAGEKQISESGAIFGMSTALASTTELLTIAQAVGKAQVYISYGGQTVNLIASSPTITNTFTVLAGRKVGTNLVGRQNGAQFGTASTSSIVSSAFTNGTLGGYWASAGILAGSIYPVIAIKGTVTDAQLLILEKWIGSMSGVTI